MSQNSGPPLPDEPIIGGPPIAPAPFPPSPGEGMAAPGTESTPAEAYVEDGYDDDGYDDGWDDEYAEDPDDGYARYYDDYDDGPPPRQPIFYVFIALAAIVGAVVIFFIFTLVRNNGGGAEPTAAAEFSVLIDSPQNNARVEVNKDQDFAIRAKSNQPLKTIGLLVDGKMATSDDVSKQSMPADSIYHASLKTTFSEKREYQVAVRVVTMSGAQHDSKPIAIVAYEPVNGGNPATVAGTVVATVSARTGPGDAFEVVSTLTAGDPVTIVGKTADGQWLLIAMGNDNNWVRAAAINVSGPLSAVPVQAAPSPTPTATSTTTPEATATPTEVPASPDFRPGDASLAPGGSTLYVTVANIGTGDYEGPLGVAISGVVGTHSRVFQVNLPANGGTTLAFPLDTPVTSGGAVAVTVDPDGAIAESREDNNSTGFTIPPPSQPTATPTEPPPSETTTPDGTETTTTAQDVGSQTALAR